jgi:hypothetical protein
MFFKKNEIYSIFIRYLTRIIIRRKNRCFDYFLSSNGGGRKDARRLEKNGWKYNI